MTDPRLKVEGRSEQVTMTKLAKVHTGEFSMTSEGRRGVLTTGDTAREGPPPQDTGARGQDLHQEAVPTCSSLPCAGHGLVIPL